MEMIEAFYIELITRYFSGEATTEELVLLDDWVKSDPVNRQIFDDYRKTWLTIEKSRITSTLDLDEEWEKLQSLIHALPGQADNKTLSDESVSPPYKGKPEPVTVGSQARKKDSAYKVLPVDMERPITRFNFYPFFRLAAVIIVLLIPAFLIYRNLLSPDVKHLVAEKSVVETLLPDGTRVTLNAGSTLDYPDHFVDDIREVSLTGEAYFTVTHDPAKPFIVSSGTVRIKVMGTSFNVNTKVKKDMLDVILTEGMVYVYFEEEPSSQVILVTGEKAAVTVADKSISKSINPDKNYLSWKTRKMTFTNQTLDEVVTTLNHVYQSELRIQTGGLGQCRLTATFDHQSLESVLLVLKSTLDITISNSPPGITLSGKGCN